MREKADGFESLLMGKHEIAGQSGKTRPDFAWYAVQWRGSQVEVVLSPHPGGRPGSAEIVCAAGRASSGNTTLLTRFEWTTIVLADCCTDS